VIARIRSSKFSRGITSEVALYTKSGDMASGTGKSKKASDKKEKQKVAASGDSDRDSGSEPEDTRTCFLCKNNGHIKRNCPDKKSRSGKDSKAKDEKNETPSTVEVGAVAATTDYLRMSRAGPGPPTLDDLAVDRDAAKAYKEPLGAGVKSGTGAK
jgi:hypothetical protein